MSSRRGARRCESTSTSNAVPSCLPRDGLVLRRLPPPLRLVLHPLWIMSRLPRTYSYDQLDEAAKERARDCVREGQCDDWYDFVLEDAVRMGQILGIEIAAETRGGSPKIYWDDEVVFVGQWFFNPECFTTIVREAPQDVELHEV